MNIFQWFKGLFENKAARERRWNALQQMEESYRNAEQARLAIKMITSPERVDEIDKEDIIDFLSDMDGCLGRIQNNAATAGAFIASNNNVELAKSLDDLL